MGYKISYKATNGKTKWVKVAGAKPCKSSRHPELELFYFDGAEFLKPYMPLVKEDDYKYPVIIAGVKTGARLSRGKTLKQALSYLDRRASKLKDFILKED